MKKLYKKLLALRKFIKTEKNEYNDLANLSDKLYFYSKGFLSSNINNYGLSKNNFNEYVPDWFRIDNLSYINQANDSIINDKVLFHQYFRNDERIVSVIAYVFDGKIYEAVNNQLIDIETLFKNNKKNLIFKTAKGGGGSGITKISVKEIGLESSLKKAKKLLSTSHNFVVQEELKQNGFANEVYPSTLNTIRVLTIKDTESGKPYIAKAVHRFGTSESNFVDNWTSGGICVDIDISKKIFGLGAVKGKESENLVFLNKHPDTMVKFEGKVVPNWDLIQDEILRLSEQLFFLKYIGWDVVPFENGFQILEANSNSDINLLQIHGGLLKDEEVRKFYENEGLSF